MTVSKDCKKLGVILGHQLYKDHKEVDELIIYKRDETSNKFNLEKHIDFEFHEACEEFEFCHDNSNKLIFFSQHEVFKYNYSEEHKETMYTFKHPLHEEPHFGVFNKD